MTAAASVRAIEAAPLQRDGIRHAFFTRHGGVSGGLYASLNGGLGSHDDPALVAANRARMASVLKVAPDRLMTAFQIHSAEVAVVDAPWQAAARPRADAIVTARPGLAVGVTTADCGPILFADTEAKVVGAAHAGWRGALGGIIEATLAAMERLGANRARICAVLGPTISRANYEVGSDLMARFRAEDPGAERFFAPAARAAHAQFDLPAYIVARLRRAGVGTVGDLGLCTYADADRFYSYRRSTHRGEPDYGRHISAIVLT
jgi:hypothetical protein